MESKPTEIRIITTDKHAFAFTVNADASDTSDVGFSNIPSSSNWEQDFESINDFRIVRWGNNNNLPTDIRNILDKNNLGEGILEKKKGLLWGDGPLLYKKVFIENKPVKQWVENAAIDRFLESFKYKEYLRNVITDFYHSEFICSKMFRNKGPRIGEPAKIAKIEHIPSHTCRLEWPGNILEKSKRIIVSDYENNDHRYAQAFPVFDENSFSRYPISVFNSRQYSFGRLFYGTPIFFGALPWLTRSNAVPVILESLSNNSLSIKWHIKTPAKYWVDVENILREQATHNNVIYNPQTLEDYKDKMFKDLANVLAGQKNVGKFFTSDIVYDEMGNLLKWEIESIDQKIKDFVDAQIEISKQSDSAVTSGMSLHPSLSNIIVDGKLASGSEQLYALKIYLTTSVNIHEDIITEAINTAIKINFPDANVKLGFYHPVLQTEDSTTSSQRLKNNV